ncbi:MAG: hypothetical protein QOD77_597 [Thermoplasmata archaeon]|jgi:broad specificity phosphatase PhoE|nr:hypothetical protein [Thermoplasmata archaeon]
MGLLFIVRHGETPANHDRILQGPRIDTQLSERGLLQAASVAEAMARHPIQALYSSPLARARQTAEAVMRGHASSIAGSLAVQVVPELYEMDYGLLAGRSYDDVAPEMAQVLDAWKLGFLDEPFPGGESARVAQHRIRPFAERVRRQAATADVAVVAHGRINRVLIATLTGAGLTRLEEFPQSNASISVLAVDEESVRVERLNDTAHLALSSETFS